MMHVVKIQSSLGTAMTTIEGEHYRNGINFCLHNSKIMVWSVSKRSKLRFWADPAVAAVKKCTQHNHQTCDSNGTGSGLVFIQGHTGQTNVDTLILLGLQLPDDEVPQFRVRFLQADVVDDDVEVARSGTILKFDPRRIQALL